MFIKFYNSKLIIFIILCMFPFELLADKKSFECRYQVKDRGYQTMEIVVDTWAMYGTVQHTTKSFSKDLKEIRSGKLHFTEQDKNYLITLTNSIGFEYHLITPDLKYLIELNSLNILGKTIEERKQITSRTHFKGDCRTLK